MEFWNSGQMNHGNPAFNVVDEYSIDDLLAEANSDLENLESELSGSADDLEEALEDDREFLCERNSESN